MNVILASASPRRKELLGHLFSEFTILPAQGEEQADFQTPSQYVSKLAEHKAMEIARTKFSAKRLPDAGPVTDYPSDQITLILGADTIVYADSQVLGKPADADEAFSMLSRLSGKSHEVYTGVSLIFLSEKEHAILDVHSFSEKTEVFVDTLTKEEILSYIASKDPLDKAGSYGIQGLFSKHITGINGDYFNVVGLPVSRIYRELKTVLGNKY